VELLSTVETGESVEFTFEVTDSKTAVTPNGSTSHAA
jgi:hypothetical protein